MVLYLIHPLSMLRYLSQLVFILGMNKIVSSLILLLLLASCNNGSDSNPIPEPNPFEDISYEVIRERQGVSFALNYYREDTIGIQVSFSEALTFLDSAFVINTFEPNKRFSITSNEESLMYAINYPIDINYAYDSLELVAIFRSNIDLRVPLVKGSINELYETETFEIFNIAGDLANGLYSDYFDSYKIKSRVLNKPFLSQEGTGAMDVFLMNFKEGTLDNPSFERSFKSFAKSEFNSNTEELLNGSKFVKLNAQMDDFQTPSQIVEAFESQKENAVYEIIAFEIGDLYAVRIHDNNSGKRFDTESESLIENFIPHPTYDLPYAIIEIVGVYDDMKTSDEGGSDDDFIALKLLSYAPPRASPF